MKRMSLLFLPAILLLVVGTTDFAAGQAKSVSCPIPEYVNWVKQQSPERSVDAITGRVVGVIIFQDHEFVDEMKNLIVEYRFEDNDELAVIEWFEVLTYQSEGTIVKMNTRWREYDIKNGDCLLKLDTEYLFVLEPK